MSDTHSTDALLQQGFERHQAGRFEDAEAFYRQALARDPRHPDANNLLGLLCIQTKRFEQAVKRIRKGLKARPDDAQAHYNLGLALKDLGRLDQAAAHFRRSAELSPENAQAHNAQGNVLRGLGRADEAVKCLQTALMLAPADPAVRRNLGDALNELGVFLNKGGRPHEAIAYFRESATITPTNIHAHINLGITLEQTGELDEAASSFKRAIEIKADFAEAHFHLAHLRGRLSSEDEIHAMEALSGHPGCNDEQRVFLAFGLGRAYEKLEQHDKSFEHFRAGHSLKTQSSSFSLAAAADYVDALIDTFSAAFVKQNEGRGCEDETPIFILGMPRSGTTLTEQILASHPQVFGAGELQLVSNAVREAANQTGQPFPRGCDQLGDSLFRRLGAHYAEQVRELSNETRHITDTTPTNFFHVGLIMAMLPRARIVHCRRDAMDTCLSIFMHPLSSSHAYAHDLRDLGGFYRLYEKLMAHWHSVLPNKIHDVSYEAMVTDTENEIRRLLDFCGLPFDEACLAFHETDRVVRTPSASQVRQPIHSGSVLRWKRYEKHLGSLKQALEGQRAGKNE